MILKLLFLHMYKASFSNILADTLMVEYIYESFKDLLL